MKEKFDSFDVDGNGFIDEHEMKVLLKYFKIELTELEYQVIFYDDKCDPTDLLEAVTIKY